MYCFNRSGVSAKIPVASVAGIGQVEIQCRNLRVVIHEVCFLTSRLAAFGERLAAVDLHALAQGQVRCRMPVVLRDSCDITPWLRELPLSLALSVFVWS